MMIKLRHKKNIIFAVIIILLGLIVFSCNHQRSIKDINEYIAELKQENNKQIKLNHSAEFNAPVAVVYKAGSLRSPFGTVAPTSQTSGISKAQLANPLLAYSLNMLRFVGTLSQKGTMFGFILAPDGIIYQVKAGDEIDDHHGKVAAVSEHQIDIMEYDTNGNVHTQHIVKIELKE